nr:unnamed protein product [Spirometra erinaceieuropaei]
MDYIHCDVNERTCELCGRAFAEKRTLLRHIDCIYEGQLPFLDLHVHAPLKQSYCVNMTAHGGREGERGRPRCDISVTLW